MTPPIGNTYAEFCAGYGGLGLAVEHIFGAELSWYFEFDAAPSKIMARHWPGVPNHGDMTTADWTALPYVDILSGGTPCQDLSGAGARKGMTEGTRSNLWVQMRDAIATIQPQYVVWENVRGAYSAKADSEMEPCPGCLGAGGGDGESVLRALGRVLGDLADLGYDCQWRGLRAADVGAPHGRFRVFILATRRDAIPYPCGIGGDETLERHGSSPTPDHGASVPNESDCEPVRTRPNRAGVIEASADPMRGRRGRPGDAAPRQEESSRSSSPARIGSGISTIADTGGPAIGEHSGEPSAQEAGSGSRDGSSDSRGERHAINWGAYAPAIARWETSRGTAPAPTELNAKGKPRLSAQFAEWMMGLDPGWITDTPGSAATIN